jgi:two-component system sensor histidine kinase TctE
LLDESLPPHRSLYRSVYVAFSLVIWPLAIAFTVYISWISFQVIRNANDRVLTAAVEAVAETISIDEAGVSYDLPIAAFSMLENEERDNVYYVVLFNGGYVSGYPELASALKDSDSPFSAKFRGETVRIATRRIDSNNSNNFALVALAETTNNRAAAISPAIMALVLASSAYVLSLSAGIPIAVRRSLRSLNDLSTYLEGQKIALRRVRIPVSRGPVELRPLLSTIDQLVSRLNGEVERSSAFAAAASHQLRTPLSVVKGEISILMKSHQLSDSDRHRVAKISSSCDSLCDIVEAFLIMHGLERYDADHHQEYNVGETISKVAIALEPLARSRDKAIDISAVGIHEIHGREAIVREAITNVITNSILHASEFAQILVSVHGGTQNVKVVISDRHRRNTTFESNLAARSGYGIGLKIVDLIMDAIGGVCEICDDDGYTVSMTIPRREAAPVKDRPALAGQP